MHDSYQFLRKCLLRTDGRRVTAAALLCIHVVPSRASYAIITWPMSTMREFRPAAAFTLFCRADVFFAARYYPNSNSYQGHSRLLISLSR